MLTESREKKLKWGIAIENAKIKWKMVTTIISVKLISEPLFCFRQTILGFELVKKYSIWISVANALLVLGELSSGSLLFFQFSDIPEQHWTWEREVWMCVQKKSMQNVQVWRIGEIICLERHVIREPESSGYFGKAEECCFSWQLRSSF